MKITKKKKIKKENQLTSKFATKNENRKFFDVNIIVSTTLLNFFAKMNIDQKKKREKKILEKKRKNQE